MIGGGSPTSEQPSTTYRPTTTSTTTTTTTTPATGPCNSGWQQNGGHQYCAHSETATWEDAEAACVNQVENVTHMSRSDNDNGAIFFLGRPSCKHPLRFGKLFRGRPHVRQRFLHRRQRRRQRGQLDMVRRWVFQLHQVGLQQAGQQQVRQLHMGVPRFLYLGRLQLQGCPALCLQSVIRYWKCNIPFTPYVRRSDGVVQTAGRSVGRLVGLNFLAKRAGSYTSMLQSEHLLENHDVCIKFLLF